MDVILKRQQLMGLGKTEQSSFDIINTMLDQWTKDLFYSNTDYTLFSVQRADGMKTWSEIKKERFNGYDVDPKTFIVIRTTAPTQNWKNLTT